MANHYNIEELLAKKFAGEASPDERRIITEWLAKDTNHPKIMADLQWVWDKMPDIYPKEAAPVNTEAALQRVKTQIQFKTAARRRTRLWYSLSGVAAAIALVLLAVWALQRPAAGPQELMAAAQTLTDTLTDGSVVTLNRNSGLLLDESYNGKTRQMRLRGEAFFKVKPDPERPFSVQADELEVTALGTSFNVRALDGSDTVRVDLVEGKLRLKGKNSSEILLGGQSAIYLRQSGTIQRLQQQDINGMAYHSRIFHFDATPLAQVVAQLNAAYPVQIRLANPALEKCQFSTDYKDAPIERIIDLLAKTFNLQVERNGQQIILNGTGCND